MSATRSPTGVKRRLLVIGLAAALVHQLGACPCGCIEGNLWLQTVLRATGLAKQLVAATPAPVGPSNQVDSTTCDGTHAKTSYVPGSELAVNSSHAGVVGVLAIVEDGFWPAGRIVPDLRLVERCANCIDRPTARTLRAQLQVFLI